MVFIPFGVGAYDNADYGLPPVVLENWYAEAAPDRPDKTFRLIPTPGAVEFASLGGGRGRGVFQSDGLHSGDIVATRGNTVYRITSGGTPTALTNTCVDDDLPVSFAVSQTPQLIMASGGTVYDIEAAQITSFTWTGPTNDISDVEEINQRHLYLEENTGRVWYSNVAAAKTVGASDFITAEREPDQLIALKVQADTIWLFGSQTIELWSETGDATTPLVPRPGGAIPIGLIGKDAVAESDLAMFAVGVSEDAGPIVYRFTQFQPQRISTNPIEALLSALSDANAQKVRLAAYGDEGHAFVQLYIPGEGDWLYDSATRQWHRRKAIALANYRYGHYVRAFSKTIAQDVTTGEAASGRLVQLSNALFDDAGAIEKRVATAIVPIENYIAIKNLVVEGQAGVGLSGSGQGSDPMGMLRIALDGRIFGPLINRPLGKIGQYGFRTLWGPLGQATPPVAVAEFSVSEPIGYTVYGANANVARP